MTKQRAAILEIIRSGAFHRTADEIFAIAKTMLPGISRATVYNNLNALCEEKIIRKISGDCGADRYDRAYEPHGHLFCTNCLEIFDINMQEFSSDIEKRFPCKVESFEIKIKGLCEKCRLKL